MKTEDRTAERNAMVDHDIEARGVRNALVLDAMRAVPREAFVPERIRAVAYDDSPQPIGAKQTISQPYIVAFMIEALALERGDTVLEIGTGSGYAAAVLGKIASQVYTVERISELAQQARETLQALDYHNVEVIQGDGSHGLPVHAPYDAIIVAAAATTIPESLKSQLKIGGRLVIPVGACESNQELILVTRRSETEFSREDIAGVRFVPLISE